MLYNWFASISMFNILLAKLICLPWFISSLFRYIDSFESTLFPTLSEISSWNYCFVSSLFYKAFLFFKEMPDVIESLEHIVFLFLITMFEFLGLIVEFLNSFKSFASATICFISLLVLFKRSSSS